MKKIFATLALSFFCLFQGCSKLQVNWKFKTGGEVHTKPLVYNGIVYFGSDDQYLYAINEETGEEKWKFKSADIIRSSPIIDKGIVYFGSNDKYLYSIKQK